MTTGLDHLLGSNKGGDPACPIASCQGDVPQIIVNEGALAAPVSSLHHILKAPGVSKGRGGSPSSNFVGPCGTQIH